MKNNVASGYFLHKYKGFSYYQENPSLAVWEAIEKILKDYKSVQYQILAHAVDVGW